MPPDTSGRRVASDRDVVYTPPWIVRDMVHHFQPGGRVLDPCRGRGAFTDEMPSAEWCEVTEGRDFFDWTTPVDWVVGNPPYSLTRAWLNHSYSIAENVLYLLPIRNVFSGYGTMREVADYGGIVEVRLYGTGNRCGFPMGNAIGAMHFRRGFRGGTVFSDQSVQNGEQRETA